MNLDYLDVLWRPTPKHREQVGTMGTGSFNADASVPDVVATGGNNGNKLSVSSAHNGVCSQSFPGCSQAFGTENPNVYAVVPTVPSVPKENQRTCDTEGGGPTDRETAKIQMSRWLGTRCAVSHRAWSAEKFLYRDYVAWCQQQRQVPCTGEVFGAILSESFHREAEGWQGLCVAMDWRRSEGIGTSRSNVQRFRTRRIQ
jgi:hypothetical protein